MPRAGLVLILCAAFASCGAPEPPRPSFLEAETHDHYAAALAEFGLDRTALGREWIAEAARALMEPIPATVPFRETGYLPPSTPTAVSYRVDLHRGRRLVIEVEFVATEAGRLFVDLFELQQNAPPRRVAEAPAGSTRLEYEVRRDGPYVLRLQPELLRGGRFTIVERTEASLVFPVEGRSLGAVESGFGAPRDGGRRRHTGVDIFAPRGTPVVAATDGIVRVDIGERGGQVIWLTDRTVSWRRRIYYAHLDEWAVTDGTVVRAGDVIGYVGNTGNARTTPPHLHFGVYDRGPVDPHPFLYRDDPSPPAVAGTLDLLGAWARVVAARAMLRAGPSARAAAVAEVIRDLPVRVSATAAAYYRVTLPDGRGGYVSVRDVGSAEAPLGRASAAGAIDVRESPVFAAPIIQTMSPGTMLEIVGRYGGFHLVRLPDERVGWVAADSDS